MSDAEHCPTAHETAPLTRHLPATMDVAMSNDIIALAIFHNLNAAELCCPCRGTRLTQSTERRHRSALWRPLTMVRWPAADRSVVAAMGMCWKDRFRFYLSREIPRALPLSASPLSVAAVMQCAIRVLPLRSLRHFDQRYQPRAAGRDHCHAARSRSSFF